MQMSNGTKIIAVVTVLLAFDYLIVALRYLARRIHKLKWQSDDWLVTIALA